MKYGGGFPFEASSFIPRWSSPSSAASPGGLAAPPPASGSTRTTAGAAGAVGCTGLPSAALRGPPPCGPHPTVKLAAAAATAAAAREVESAGDSGERREGIGSSSVQHNRRRDDPGELTDPAPFWSSAVWC